MVDFWGHSLLLALESIWVPIPDIILFWSCLKVVIHGFINGL